LLQLVFLYLFVKLLNTALTGSLTPTYANDFP
jgi:hypothetical protein